MKKILLNGFGVFAIALMAIACKKDSVTNSISPERPDKSSLSAAAFTTTDVYTGGLYNLNGVNNSVIQYWLNTNSPTTLTPNTQQHTFTDIETYGTDLYVVGYQNQSVSPTFVSKYWKNGVVTTLTKPTGSNYATAQAITISGTNVYVAGTALYPHPSGYYQSRMVLWTNGVVSVLGNASYNTSTTDLVIAGNTIYITGTKSNIIGQTSPSSIYLQNGTEYTLPSSTGGAVFAAVAGSDVYMTSITGSYATSALAVWKNGAAYTSFTGGPDSYPSNPSIATSGSDVYLTVNGRTNATNYDNNVFVWKNSGAPFRTLTSAPYSGTTSTPYYTVYPRGLRVNSTGDVYLLGCTTTGNHGYWINNTFNVLAKPAATYSQGIALMEY